MSDHFVDEPVLSTMGVPLRWVGPIAIKSPFAQQLSVPIATYETTLWPSIARGAKISRLCSGISIHLHSHSMTRSIALRAGNGMLACAIADEIMQVHPQWQSCVQATSRYAKLLSMQCETVGPIIYCRLAFSTGDAAGHNMTTKAAESILNAILNKWPQLHYVCLSANVCTDKKVSAVNAILGRGYRVSAELCVCEEICKKHLHTTPEAIEQLHIHKNLIGSVLAGSIRSANAHYANMLLGLYLATGQDGANIVEGSQGITHARAQDGFLQFSCSLPSVIVGTVGHGKDREQVRQNLRKLGCCHTLTPGENASRLAAIVAATVLCGELSLMAALTRSDELMRAHHVFERLGYGSTNPHA